MSPKKSSKSPNIHKQFKSLIQRRKASVLTLLVVDNKVVIMGNQRLVALAKNDQTTIEDLAKELILQEKDKDTEIFSYKEFSTNHIILPKTSVKIRSASWTVKTARSILKEYLKIFNLGKGMPLNYQIKENEPAGWPETLSFEDFRGVSYVNKEQATLIIESLIQYHAKVDPVTYFETPRQNDEPESGDTSEEENVRVDIQDDNQEQAQEQQNYGNNNIYQPDQNNQNQNNYVHNMPLHLDPSGAWYWDYYLQQWFPYQPANGGLNQ